MPLPGSVAARRRRSRRRAIESAGGTTIVRQPDSAASLVGVDVVVRAGLDRQTMKQNGLAAFVAQTILRTPVRRQVAGAAAFRSKTRSPRAAARFASPSIRATCAFTSKRLPSDAPAVLDLFRTALAAPDFSPATVRDARSALMRQIAQSQQIALQVGLDMLNAASSTQANAGLPELGTPASLAQLFSSDARAFYRAYYRRGGATGQRRRTARRASRRARLRRSRRRLPDGTTVAGARSRRRAERRNARDRRASRYRRRPG